MTEEVALLVVSLLDVEFEFDELLPLDELLLVVVGVGEGVGEGVGGTAISMMIV